jgi:hypothetical protein
MIAVNAGLIRHAAAVTPAEAAHSRVTFFQALQEGRPVRARSCNRSLGIIFKAWRTSR